MQAGCAVHARQKLRIGERHTNAIHDGNTVDFRQTRLPDHFGDQPFRGYDQVGALGNQTFRRAPETGT